MFPFKRITDKSPVPAIVFTVTLLYLVSPWFFERKLLFNELLCFAGLLIWASEGFTLGRDYISKLIYFFLAVCAVHLITSIWRADSLYYYLRNTVIVYSVLPFFTGLLWLKYFRVFMDKIWKPLTAYLAVGLLIPVGTFPLQSYFYERFGMAMLFPFAIRGIARKWLLPLMILICAIYAFTYGSATAMIMAAFFGLIWICTGYQMFKWICLAGLIGFAALFIYFQPNLSLIRNQYSPFNDNGILDVRHSNKLLAVDPNSTWRLVLWKEVIVDHFPENIPGMGFGTRIMEYYPVEDYKKLATLPYVLGAHNSYVYLFGRLGILYLVFAFMLYRYIFRQYFKYKEYWYSSGDFRYFWSFFVISVIAVFNPSLESPIYSGAYWFFLGLLAAVMRNRAQAEAMAPAP